MEPGIVCLSSHMGADHARALRSAVPHTGRVAQAVAAGNEGAGQVWARSFLFAGLSALLLAIAAMHPRLVFLPCCALIPFFYALLLDRDRSSQPINAIRLGFLLGLAYCGVTLADSMVMSPPAALLKLAGGTALFALFGWAAGRARQRWGFNPVILAMIWVAFEFTLIKLGLVGDMLSTESIIGRPEQGPSAILLYKTAVTFGILTFSFVIVLLNSVFALAIDLFVSMATARGMALPESEETRDLFLTPGLLAQRLLLVSEGRGPPRPKIGLSKSRPDTNSIPLAAGE